MASFRTLVLIGLLAAAGCQQQAATSMVDQLPPPNFSGPAFVERPVAPPPAPVVVQAPVRPQPVPLPAASAGSAEAIPAGWAPNVATRRWYWIVIHHSATPTGGAAAFDKMHRAKGWDELGYHFVIGNGTDTRDGQIEVGPRWTAQKWGAHDKTPGNQFNEHGIGICLVGNFDVSHPSAAQIKSLEKLVAYLSKTYHIPSDHVLGHGETKATDCPGRFMNVAMIRRNVAHMLQTTPGHARAEDTNSPRPGEELLAESK